MANHVPRLGRRSLSPFNSKQRNGFRFFGGVGDGGASGEPARKIWLDSSDPSST